MLFSTSKWCCLYLLGKITVNTQGEKTYQEGGSVSRVNIGRLITISVTSRHTSMIFKMAGNFFVRYFLQKMIIFRRSGNFFCLARMAKHLKNRKE